MAPSDTPDLAAAAVALHDLVAPFLAEDQPIDDRVAALNTFRGVIADLSPMRDEPVDRVEWVPAADVQGNAYNPNHVAEREMELLRVSITDSGFTQPIVSWTPSTGGKREVVDGFHRHLVGKNDPTVRARLRGYLPVTRIRGDRTGEDARKAATIQHNRARGEHAIPLMAEIVVDYHRRGKSDEWIMRELGMDLDEVTRLRQVLGIAAAFADQAFSEAWDVPPKGQRPSPIRDTPPSPRHARRNTASSAAPDGGTQLSMDNTSPDPLKGALQAVTDAGLIVQQVEQQDLSHSLVLDPASTKRAYGDATIVVTQDVLQGWRYEVVPPGWHEPKEVHAMPDSVTAPPEAMAVWLLQQLVNAAPESGDTR